MSPEVLDEYYSGKLYDAWCLGVLLYCFLIGVFPFTHPSIPFLIVMIKRVRFRIPQFISLEARVLLRSLLRISTERMRVEDILASSWLARDHTTVQIHPTDQQVPYN